MADVINCQPLHHDGVIMSPTHLQQHTHHTDGTADITDYNPRITNMQQHKQHIAIRSTSAVYPPHLPGMADIIDHNLCT